MNLKEAKEHLLTGAAIRHKLWKNASCVKIYSKDPTTLIDDDCNIYSMDSFDHLEGDVWEELGGKTHTDILGRPTINMQGSDQKEGLMEKEPILQFFDYEHLRTDLQAISKPFGDLARTLVEILPRNAERTVALRKLLEGKDAAVRASFMKG